MACMTHSCKCGHVWFNNTSFDSCPECGGGGTQVVHMWDEVEYDEEIHDED